MKKLLALAAAAGILASAIAAPLPVLAEEGVPNCAIFPLLKAECRAAMRDAVAESTTATVVATNDVASKAVVVTTGAVMNAVDTVTGWSCMRTKGGPALFSCSKS